MVPLVPMIPPMVTLAPMVPLATEKRSGFSGHQWYHWLPMVPLVKFPMVPLGESRTHALFIRQGLPVGAPLDLSTPTGMSCIGTYGENFKSDNVSKYRVLLVAFLLL